MAQDGTGGEGDGFSGDIACSGKVGLLEILEPLDDFFRLRVGEKQTNLALDLLETLSARQSEDIGERTLASLESPSLCSASGDVPNALAMTAFRPKIILAVLDKIFQGFALGPRR